MASLAAMSPLLLGSGLSFLASGETQIALVATFLVLFTMAYSPGAGKFTRAQDASLFFNLKDKPAPKKA